MVRPVVPGLLSLSSLSLTMLACAGCFGAADEPPPPPSLVETSLDRGGAVSPTATIMLRLSRPPDPDTLAAGVVIARGAADDALVRDLGRAPIPDDALVRLVPVRVLGAPDDPIIRVVPSRPLDPDALHTLLVLDGLRAGGRRLDRLASLPFHTGPASSGAATWTLAAPLPGASGVVRNIRQIDVVFSKQVDRVDEDSLLLLDDWGATVPSEVRPGAGPLAFAIRPLDALPPLMRLRVVATEAILDEDGAPPFPLDPPPGFTTVAEIRAQPPLVTSLDLAAGSGCVVARFGTDVPAAGRLCVDGRCVEEPAPRALPEIAAPLAAGAAAGLLVTARDVSTAPEARLGPIAAPASSPRPLSITEVLAHPLGARLAQQFVEVQNRGGAPVSLAGLQLHDDSGFDVLPDVTVPPGGYALIVTADYREDDGLDPRPAPGTAVARVAGASLGKNGIRETGERVELVEPDGRPVSRFSTEGLRLAAGQSARRAGPCDVGASFAPTPGGSSTPGAP